MALGNLRSFRPNVRVFVTTPIQVDGWVDGDRVFIHSHDGALLWEGLIGVDDMYVSPALEEYPVSVQIQRDGYFGATFVIRGPLNHIYVRRFDRDEQNVWRLNADAGLLG